MMRSLWTAGSGMLAQQLNVDVIANNLANVNTTSFKKDRVEFKDLMYETIERANILENEGRPVNLQVGHGTIPVSTIKSFTMGSLEPTDNPLDFAINGEAFFMVLDPAGNVLYTRDGSFKVSMSEFGKRLTTSEGYPVLDDTWNEIIIDVDINKLNISEDGELSYIDESGVTIPMGQRIGLVKFDNVKGLESTGRNFYAETEASGEPVLDWEQGERSILMQRYLETSNVQIVEEMVKLIVAQRAYEISSKAVQSSDEMMGIANNLKR